MWSEIEPNSESCDEDLSRGRSVDSNAKTPRAANGPERRADKDPWADAKFFTPYGTPVPEDELTEAFRLCRTVYVFEGGTFMWPGVSVGHSITVPIKPQYW